MNARFLALALTLSTASAAAQDAGTGRAPPRPAPATAPRPRTPAAPRDAGTTDLVAAATQAINTVAGVVGNASQTPAPQANPPSEEPVGAVPAQVLRSVGLDPNGLPGLLGPFLRSGAGRRQRLSPEQLTQLAQLAGRNLSRAQLESVATAFTRAAGAAPQGDPPTLSPEELARVAQLATRGASATALRNAVTGMLRP